MMILLMAACLACAAFTRQPVETVAVTVTVRSGDTMEGIIYDLKEAYNDRRDWREIYAQAKRDNTFTRYIVPGQQIVFRMEQGK